MYEIYCALEARRFEDARERRRPDCRAVWASDAPRGARAGLRRQLAGALLRATDLLDPTRPAEPAPVHPGLGLQL